MKGEEMRILAIDPGPTESAFVIWDGEMVLAFGKAENNEILHGIKTYPSSDCPKPSVCIIEQIKSYGMSVADSVFDTVYWTGRFREAWGNQGFFDRIPRKEVKMHLCGKMQAKDGNIIQALKDRFEPGLLPRQRPVGILKGLSKDAWQAMALAVTFYDKEHDGGPN